MSQETGKPLLVYTGWLKEGQCHVSDAVRRALRTLAAGEDKSSAKYRALLREKFVLLSDFIKSVEDENKTHGPEAEEFEKFQIEITYTPVLTFKDSEGKTLATRVGLSLKSEEALEELRQLIDQALQQNGPIKAPGKTRALARGFEAGKQAQEAGRVAPAIREYLKVIELGGNAKNFPERTPVLAMEARQALGRLELQAIHQLDELWELSKTDPPAAQRGYQQLSREYGQLESIQTRITQALEGL